jgi:hypothetical protein
MTKSELRASKDSQGFYEVTCHGRIVLDGYFASANEAKDAALANYLDQKAADEDRAAEAALDAQHEADEAKADDKQAHDAKVAAWLRSRPEVGTLNRTENKYYRYDESNNYQAVAEFS